MVPISSSYIGLFPAKCSKKMGAHHTGNWPAGPPTHLNIHSYSAQSLQWYVQYHVILVCDITALDCISQLLDYGVCICTRSWGKVWISVDMRSSLTTPSIVFSLCQFLSSCWTVPTDIEGILPKGPYLPWVSMAGRALLAGYHRHLPIGIILIMDKYLE